MIFCKNADQGNDWLATIATATNYLLERYGGLLSQKQKSSSPSHFRLISTFTFPWEACKMGSITIPITSPFLKKWIQMQTQVFRSQNIHITDNCQQTSAFRRKVSYAEGNCMQKKVGPEIRSSKPNMGRHKVTNTHDNGEEQPSRVTHRLVRTAFRYVACTQETITELTTSNVF